MRIGQKLRDAITSSFIEVRLDAEQEALAVGNGSAPVEASPYVPASEPALSVEAPEPEPVPDPLAPPQLGLVIRDDGSLNDDVIYASATLAPVAFSAEQAVEVLIGIPYGVTARGRCQVMEQAILVVTDDPCATGHLVVSDAAQKMVALNQYLARNRENLKGFRRNVSEEMEHLHERLNQLRVLVDETNANYQALEEAGRMRVDNLTGVIAFFDEFQAYLRQEEQNNQTSNERELPAYLREETAMKILGVQPTEKRTA